MAYSSNTLLSFGLITDIQFADRDDGYDYHKISKRYYRNALVQVKTAIKYWNSEQNKVNFVLELGDLIDAYNHRNGQQQEALSNILKVFSSYPGVVHYVWGNHELYNFRVEELLRSSLNSSINQGCKAIPGKGYYSFTPHEYFKILILNCYEQNIIDKSGPNYKESLEICKVNPNVDHNDSTGMDDSTCMFVAFNGGIGLTQLQWMNQCLQEADELSQNVIICGHVPIYGKSCDYHNVCWDSSAILQVIHQHNCVLAYLAGHDHNGGSAIDEKGIYHIVIAGVIETQPNETCFATAKLCPETLYIYGHGKMDNFQIPLKYPIGTMTQH